MKLSDLKMELEKNRFQKTFSVLYGTNQIERQTKRYAEALSSFGKAFGFDDETDVNLYSAPGRVEVIGNHTDHQRGKVVATSIHLDVLAVVKSGGSTITILSEGYKQHIIDITDTTIDDAEKNTFPSLVKGIAAYFKNEGYSVGGFTAYITSDVLRGSGLSSSAAFETLIGTILNHEYNEDRVSAIEIAKAGQFAERVYFGKPCGLMDQMASSVGNVVAIDFFDADNPKVEAMEIPLEKFAHTLCVVDTGGNHADLTHEYASIPPEMKAVAGFFNKEVLSQVAEADFTANFAALRPKVGDRAVLRAFHYYGEDRRVTQFCKALHNNDFEASLQILKDSGHSSFQYLQNVFSVSNSFEQGLSIGLAIADRNLEGRGAYRVHGGGFAGTILAVVPNDLLGIFEKNMCQVFGKDCCHKMYLRPVGASVVGISMRE